MEIRRIVPNIISTEPERSKEFYRDFLGLKLVMDMQWVLTFASESNPTAQISIVKDDQKQNSNADSLISIEVANVDSMYEKAKSFDLEITYPVTNESWGVRRFFVRDPNGTTINILSHLHK